MNPKTKVLSETYRLFNPYHGKEGQFTDRAHAVQVSGIQAVRKERIAETKAKREAWKKGPSEKGARGRKARQAAQIESDKRAMVAAKAIVRDFGIEMLGLKGSKAWENRQIMKANLEAKKRAKKSGRPYIPVKV